MKMKLYEYAVLWHPNKKEEEDGKRTEMLIAPTVTLSQDEKSVGMKAAMSIPPQYQDKLDQIDILIRPF